MTSDKRKNTIAVTPAGIAALANFHRALTTSSRLQAGSLREHHWTDLGQLLDLLLVGERKDI